MAAEGVGGEENPRLRYCNGRSRRDADAPGRRDADGRIVLASDYYDTAD